MKQLKIWMLAMVLTGLCSSLYASGLGVFGSYWDTEDAKDAVGFGAKLELDLIPGTLAVETRGTWYGDFEDNKLFQENEIEIVPIELGLVVDLVSGDAVDLYVGGGVTYLLLESDKGDVDDEVGYYLTGGIDAKLTKRISIFAEIFYRKAEGQLDSDDDDLGDLIDAAKDGDATIDLKGIGGVVGIKFQ